MKTLLNDAKFLFRSNFTWNQPVPCPVRPFHCTNMDSALAQQIYDKLLSVYGPQKCFLEHMTPFQLLVATILSAQCTDKRVNMVTRELFKRWPDAESFAACDRDELEQAIFTCGFYRAKASHIIEASKAIVERFHGEIPDTMEGLLRLPGVGRKTANVILSNCFDEPAFAVDTHVARVSKRLQIADPDDDVRTVEEKLMQYFPKMNRYLQKGLNPTTGLRYMYLK